MADRIGRADYELRADQTGLVNDLKDAEGKITASGDKVEKSAVGTGLAFKAAAATAAVGFGLMAKGAVEMESAQGKFQAATGASREEAIAFSKDMNSLMGTSAAVGKSFEQVTDAGVEVSRQFGVQGEEAKDLTEDMLAYSKVTGADAVQSTLQLEDTLSAYGLSAADASGFMDQLIASNQKFGTDAGPATLGVLQGMAPALQAMGMEIDDGIALLNAFEVAGVDAAGAQRGLNSAITNLPEGQTLEGFLQHLQDLRNQGIDPTAEAIEVFGNKAGAALALAIKPGGNALDDFRITAEEAAGTTEKAADDMLTTTDKIRMFADKVTGALRGLGQDIGPVLSGLGGVATLAAALPANLTKPLTDGIKATWGKVGGSTAVKGAIAAAGAIAGTIYGNASAAAEYLMDLVHEAWEKLMSAGPVRAAVAFAGTVAGGIYSAAATVAELLVGGMSKAWVAVGSPGSSVVMAAQAAGVTAGTAFMAGAAIGLPLAAHALAPAIRQGIEEGFGLEDKGWFHGTVIDSIGDFLSPDSPAATLLTQAGYTVGENGAVSIGDGFAGAAPTQAQRTADIMASETYQAWRLQETGYNAVGEETVDAIGTGVERSEPELARQMMALADAARQRAADKFYENALTIGRSVPTGIGQGMADESREIITAADNLRNILKNGLTPDEQASKVLGRKWINLFRQGLESEIPGAREAAFRLGVEGLQALSQGTIGTDEAKRIAQIAAGLYADGWDSREIMVALAAQGVGEEALRELARVSGWDDEAVEDALDYIDGLESKENAAGNAGEDLGETALDGANDQPWEAGGRNSAAAWIGAFGRTIDAREQGIINKLRSMSRAFIGQSPPPEGPLKDLDKGGYRAFSSWVDAGERALIEGRARLGGALTGLQPAFGLGAIPGTMSAMGGGGMVTMRVDVGGVNVNVTVDGGGDPVAIGDAVGDRVRAALDDVFATAERGTGLRWSEA